MRTPRPLTRYLTAAAVVLLLVLSTGAPAAAAEGFRFSGSGWGHGVGMSQYGALEQARDGRSAEQIIAHYYSGATASARNLNLGPIRVGLQQDLTALNARAIGGEMAVRFGGSGGPVHNVGPGTQVRIQRAGSGSCRIYLDGDAQGPERSCWANFFRTTATAVSVSNEARDYSHGQLRVRPRPDGDAFHVAIEIYGEDELDALDTYLLGLREVPASWPQAALQAQAIAGRSYATFDLLGSNSFDEDGCYCHLYDSQRSQVYRGSGETSPWRTAVEATSGQVVYDQGAPGTRSGVVQAFYSSSSGGRTEAIEDSTSFSSAPRSYFRSVDDPWSLRASNPYAYWTNNVAESTIRQRLNLDDVQSVRVTARNESGSARRVVFTGTRNGREVQVTRAGGELRGSSGIGLRSAYISSVFLPPFVDDDGNIHEGSIAWIADQDITKGCNPPTNNRFCPDSSVTRGQMAAFLTRALDLPAGSRAFRDTRGSVFRADIGAIARAGITVGCNPPANDRYCPDQPVTRAQMASFLARALDLPNRAERFRDVGSGNVHQANIGALAGAGITAGCNPPANDEFCPDDPVTRAQMATFLFRSRGRLG